MSSPGEWYGSLPPITKLFGTSCVLMTLGLEFGLVDPAYAILDWKMIIYKFQIWRLFSNFILLGGFGINFCMRLLMLVRYGVALEQTAFEGRTADYAFMMLFCMACFLALSCVIPMVVFGAPMIFCLVYVWSRYTPTQPVNLMGVVKIKAFYLPWALLLLNRVMGGSVVPDLMGVFVGHTYFFMKELFPTDKHPDLLQTPKFLTDYIQRLYGGYGYVNPNYQAPAAAPRAWQGRGQRLGGN